MDSGTLQGIGTILAIITFLAICRWAYSPKNRQAFEEAAQIPFAGDGPDHDNAGEVDSHNE